MLLTLICCGRIQITWKNKADTPLQASKGTSLQVNIDGRYVARNKISHLRTIKNLSTGACMGTTCIAIRLLIQLGEEHILEMFPIIQFRALS
jgi:hypothetical protein